MAGLQQCLGTLGLQLNAAKTKVWSAAGREALLPVLLPYYTPALPVLGAVMKASDDNEEGSVLHLGGEPSGLDEVTKRLKSVWQTLTRLQKAGLSRQATASLLRSYAGAASQYALQLQLPTQESVQEYDGTLLKCWQELADRSLDNNSQERLGLPLRYGGCGAQYASTRRYAAYWGSAAATIGEVVLDNGFHSTASFLEAAPAASAKLEQARAGLVRQGISSLDGTALADALHSKLNQSLLVALVQKRKQKALLRSLPEHQAADLRGAGGPGAAGFLEYPSEPVCSIEDTLWSVALRQRVGTTRAEASTSELGNALQTCCCKAREGQPCNEQLDVHGFHAMTEQRGGGVMSRHNRLKRAIGGLIKRWCHQEPRYEQRVPAWDRQSRSNGSSSTEHAILDIEYSDEHGTRWIDVTVRHPAAGGQPALRNAATRDGEASRRGEREKHTRYPGNNLIPFVVETPGRIGAEGRFWLLAQVRCLPDDMQSKELDRAYRVISCAIQSEVSKQLRRAAGLK